MTALDEFMAVGHNNRAVKKKSELKILINFMILGFKIIVKHVHYMFIYI